MLKRVRKSSTFKYLARIGGVLFVAEALTFAGGYYIWHKLNTDRDFRYYVNNKYPTALEYYYTIGEKFGYTQIRQIDSLYWQNKDKDQ